MANPPDKSGVISAAVRLSNLFRGRGGDDARQKALAVANKFADGGIPRSLDSTSRVANPIPGMIVYDPAGDFSGPAPVQNALMTGVLQPDAPPRTPTSMFETLGVPQFGAGVGGGYEAIGQGLQQLAQGPTVPATVEQSELFQNQPSRLGTVRQMGPGVADTGRAIAEYGKGIREAQPKPQIENYQHVKSLGDLGTYIWESVQQAAGSTVPMVAAGAAAGPAGVVGSGWLMGVGQMRRSVGEEQQKVIQASNVAAAAGNNDEATRLMGIASRLDPVTQSQVIYAAGSVIGALDSLFPASLFAKSAEAEAVKRLTAEYVTKTIASAAMHGMAKEGVTETLQQGAEVLALAKAKGAQAAAEYAKALNDNAVEIIDAGLRGAIGGGGMAGAGRAASVAGERDREQAPQAAPQQPTPQAPTLPQERQDPQLPWPVAANQETPQAVTSGPSVSLPLQVAALRREAAAIQSSLPPAPEGTTRVWSGDRPTEANPAPSFTMDLVGGALPTLKSQNGVLSYLDIPTSDLPRYTSPSGAEVRVPPEIAAQAVVAGVSPRSTPQASAPVAANQNDVRPEWVSAVADAIMQRQQAAQSGQTTGQPIAQQIDYASVRVDQPVAATGQTTVPIPVPQQDKQAGIPSLPLSAPMRVITPDGSMEIQAVPELVELDDLRFASGSLQPRDRSRSEYVQGALARASQLDPLQLQPSRVSDTGAPIVMPDGTIVSGNGRALSITDVYTNPDLADRAEAYKASLGPAAANMRRPVLVMRAPSLTDQQAVQFADLSNRGRIAQMSATERALRDAQAMGLDGIGLYQGGEFTAPQNQRFLQDFMRRAVTDAERPSISRDGELTQDGVARMRAAVLAAAYGDADVLARMLESTDNNIRSITAGLLDAAPRMAQLRAGVASGEVGADMDPVPALMQSVRTIADLRSRKVSVQQWLAQNDAFGRDPVVEAWVKSFYYDDTNKAKRQEKIAALLNDYATKAFQHKPDGLFADETTSADVLNAARRKNDADIFTPASGMGQGVPQGRQGEEGRADGVGRSRVGQGDAASTEEVADPKSDDLAEVGERYPVTNASGDIVGWTDVRPAEDVLAAFGGWFSRDPDRGIKSELKALTKKAEAEGFNTNEILYSGWFGQPSDQVDLDTTSQKVPAVWLTPSRDEAGTYIEVGAAQDDAPANGIPRMYAGYVRGELFVADKQMDSRAPQNRNADGTFTYDPRTFDAMLRHAKEFGYAGVRFKNIVDMSPIPHDQVAIFDKNDVLAQSVKPTLEEVERVAGDRDAGDILAASIGSSRRAAAMMMLKRGQTYKLPRNLVSSVHDALEPHMPMVPEGYPVGVLDRIEPIADAKPGEASARAVFTTKDGDEIYLRGRPDQLLGLRAAYVPGRNGAPSSIVFLRFDLGGEIGQSLGGELGHEVTHVIRRNSIIADDAWLRLVRHANDLRLLDSDLRAYLQSIGNESYKTTPAGRSVRSAYEGLYAKRADFDEVMNQEAVAHLVELYHNRQLIPQEVQPVRDLLDSILDGSIWRGGQEGTGQQGELELMGAAQGNIPAERKPNKNLDMSVEARKERARDLGYDTSTVWYHGANRSDRIAKSGKFDPKRATSGPMAFFTNDPQVASNYSTGKQDTSMPDDISIAQYFTVSPKDVGHTRSRTPYTVEQSWNYLTPEQRREIMAKAKRVGYSNQDSGDGEIILHPEGVDASISGNQFDYYMKTSARGNPLSALRELWHDSGAIFGEEQLMADIWRLAGYPHKISQENAPWTENPGVLPVYLRMANPLDAMDYDNLTATVIPALEDGLRSDRTRRKEFGSDGWDKNSRYTPKEWVQQLKDDVAAGKVSYVWTSIPDKVTDVFKRLGYDGIVDRGNKGGNPIAGNNTFVPGDDHTVAIPFYANNVRSVMAAFDPKNYAKDDLLAAIQRNRLRDQDSLGYYSQALEAARSLKQAKGTPEQMLAQLKSAGVKQAEIEATGLNTFLDGKKSVTRDDIVGHLEGARVGLMESQRFVDPKKAERDRLRAEYRAQRGLPRDQQDPQLMAELESRIDDMMDEFAEDAEKYEPKWQNYSLDPSNPTYRETVLHLPRNEGLSKEDMQRMWNEDVPAGRMTQDQVNARIASYNQTNFNSGHFPEPNIIGHIMSEMVHLSPEDTKRLLPGWNKDTPPLVWLGTQFQSDWGQKLRDGGVRDEAKIAEAERLYREANAKALAMEADRLPTLTANGAEALTKQKFGDNATWATLSDEQRHEVAKLSAENTAKNTELNRRMDAAGAESDRLEAEWNTARNSAPGHPLVNTTDQWTNTTLRRAIRMAAEADAEYIAIPHGDTVLSYNPGDEAGMRGFYGSRSSEGIVPKNLRKILEKIDKDAAKPIKVDELETTSGLQGWNTANDRSPNPSATRFDQDQTGFTLFPLTDRVKQEVLDEGQPLFAFGGVQSPEANISAYTEAVVMNRRGASAQEILDATGWYKDKAGKWKFWNEGEPSEPQTVAESRAHARRMEMTPEERKATPPWMEQPPARISRSTGGSVTSDRSFIDRALDLARRARKH